jgi:hypothetical protein
MDSSYRAISPRFAISTEVSGLAVVAVVEICRVREAVLAASNWRDRFLDLRTARIVTVEYYRGDVVKRVNQTSPDFVCSCYPSAQCGV